MRAFIPVRLSQGKLPPKSGEYYTDLGKIYFDAVHNEFKVSRDSMPLPPFVIGTWFKEIFLEGYVDGTIEPVFVHSIEDTL